MANSANRGAAYRKRAAAQVIKTFNVQLPSGAEFLLREPNLQMFVISGALPLGVAEKMERSKKAGATDEEAFSALDPKEQIKSIEFATKLVRHICVSPKIVDSPQTDDEIAPDELLEEDFTFLVEWAQSGGSEAKSLDNFRGGRLDDAVDRAGEPELQLPT